jgi:hypothetical protein
MNKFRSRSKANNTVFVYFLKVDLRISILENKLR